MKKAFTLICASLLIPMIALAGEEFPEIEHDALMKAIENGEVTVIDVNGNASYEQGRIPGAINFVEAKDDLAAKLPEDKDALIVAYCGNEMCSAYKRAAKAASELGYTNVKHYKPGIAGWKSKDAPIEKSES